ncbi:MAG: hypothetical protein RLZZ48_89, partial [Actinomycetota bacterium]
NQTVALRDVDREASPADGSRRWEGEPRRSREIHRVVARGVTG